MSQAEKKRDSIARCDAARAYFLFLMDMAERAAEQFLDVTMLDAAFHDPGEEFPELGKDANRHEAARRIIRERLSRLESTTARKHTHGD